MGNNKTKQYGTAIDPMKERISGLMALTSVRLILLVVLLLFVVLMRHYYGAFNVSLRYLYMIIITLASFWFGLMGGLVSATLSIAIFFSEIIIFSQYDYHSLVVKGTVIRLTAYYACGIIIGIMSDRNRLYREKLNEMAYYDELTGCLNFRFITELFKRELLQSERTGAGLRVVMLDIDNFKLVNDRYGHLTGNRVLRWFASILMQNVRGIDIVGRYGGDEFLLIFPDCSDEQIGAIFNRIKSGIENEDVPGFSAQSTVYRSLQFSAGVVSYPESGTTVEELLDSADRALYRAKNAGKNIIIVERMEPAARSDDRDLF